MTNINDDVIKLVVARLSVMPSSMKIHIEGYGSFTRDELIRHVKLAVDDDKIGKLIIDMHLNFIKSVANPAHKHCVEARVHCLDCQKTKKESEKE